VDLAGKFEREAWFNKFQTEEARGSRNVNSELRPLSSGQPRVSTFKVPAVLPELCE
jgi:hypothetical protein